MRFLRQQPPPSPSSSLTATLTGHGGAVNAVGFSPDGRLLASAGSDWRVILWDVADPAHPAQRATLTHPRPDPRERPSIWRDGMIGRSPRFDPGVKAVGFSPDGRLLASGSSGRTVLLWDVADPAHPDVRATLAHPRPDRYTSFVAILDGGINAVGFSPDARLLVCSCDKTVILWDIADPARPVRRAALAHHDRPTRTGAVKAVRFSPDGRLLATGASGKDSAIVWDVTDPEHPARTAAIRPQGRDWAAKMAESQHPRVNAVAFSPDGRLLATGLGEYFANQYGSGSRGTVALWDVTDPALPVRAATLPHTGGGDGHAVAFSPDGRLLACDHEHATVILWDVTDPACPARTATLTGHRGRVQAVAFSPDGRLLATCGTDKTVRLWDVG